MNGKQEKRIRRRAKELAYEWFLTVLPEGSEVTVQEVLNKLPTTTHIYTNNQLRLMPYTFKWFCKKVKQKGLEATLEKIKPE